MTKRSPDPVSTTLSHQSFSGFDVRTRHPTGPILVTTDGETTSASLFTAARLLAERTGARVEVLAVLEPIPLPAAGLGLESAVAMMDAGRETALRARVKALLGDAGVAEGEWPLTVAYGSIAYTIAQAARQRRASTILMEKHHHSAFGRLFGADTVLGALRHADRVVLSVPKELAALPSRAVVAVDFGPSSFRAARTALALLRAPATLTLVHVTPRIAAEPELREMYEPAYRARVADLFRRLKRELHAPPGIELRTANPAGDPVWQVLNVAKQEGADLLACGSHGRGPVGRFFVGGTASAIVREAAAGCAVLVTPPPSAAESVLIERHIRGVSGGADPATWAPLLDEVTHRNAGRRAHVEVDDPESGALVQGSGFAFLGATYDRHDGRVELMLGDPGGQARRHLTRIIPGATSVDVQSDAEDQDLALRVEHGAGQTLVIFDR